MIGNDEAHNSNGRKPYEEFVFLQGSGVGLVLILHHSEQHRNSWLGVVLVVSNSTPVM